MVTADKLQSTYFKENIFQLTNVLKGILIFGVMDEMKFTAIC